MALTKRKSLWSQKRFIAYVIMMIIYGISIFIPERFSSILYKATVVTIIYWIQEVVTDIFSLWRLIREQKYGGGSSDT